MLRRLTFLGLSLAALAPFASAQTNEDLELIASDGAAKDRFGYSVAVSGNIAVIGAEYDDDNWNGTNSGSAYVFDVTSGQELFKLTASDGAAYDQFGCSVAVSGNTCLLYTSPSPRDATLSRMPSSA